MVVELCNIGGYYREWNADCGNGYLNSGVAVACGRNNGMCSFIPSDGATMAEGR